MLVPKNCTCSPRRLRCLRCVNEHVDVFAVVRFLSAIEGGRKTDFMLEDHHIGCELISTTASINARILLVAQTLRLGRTYKIPLELSQKSQAPVFDGSPVSLLEDHTIAVGKLWTKGLRCNSSTAPLIDALNPVVSTTDAWQLKFASEQKLPCD